MQAETVRLGKKWIKSLDMADVLFNGIIMLADTTTWEAKQKAFLINKPAAIVLTLRGGRKAWAVIDNSRHYDHGKKYCFQT